MSVSQVGKTIAYIENQKEHHRKKTFEEEFLELLRRHRLELKSRTCSEFSRPLRGLYLQIHLDPTDKSVGDYHSVRCVDDERLPCCRYNTQSCI